MPRILLARAALASVLPAKTLIALITIRAGGAAAAGDYPPCLRGCDFGSGDRSYYSYQQCKAAAAGRDAWCDANPSFQMQRAARRPLQPKEILMRILALTILAAGTLLATVPTHAQTYDPNFPVCLHVYGRVGYIDCRYTTLSQCKFSASGRSASCEINPYYAGAGLDSPVARHHRRHHRAY